MLNSTTIDNQVVMFLWFFRNVFYNSFLMFFYAIF